MTLTVCIVDDDDGTRRAVSRLAQALGYPTRDYPSVASFMIENRSLGRACVISDLAMPEADGLELQSQIKRSGIVRPIIFLTGVGNIRACVEAMRAGAVDFLTKPVSTGDLRQALQKAEADEEKLRAIQVETDDAEVRLLQLTNRERQVFSRVIAGKLNKQIAAELGCAEKTVKIHRSRVMMKLHARNLPELIHLGQIAHIDYDN
jgi:FixJ family two-component response regulator